MVSYFKNRNILLQNANQITSKETNDVSLALVQYATVNLPPCGLNASIFLKLEDSGGNTIVVITCGQPFRDAARALCGFSGDQS